MSRYHCSSVSTQQQLRRKQPISSNGVLRYFISPSNGPLFSAAAFLRMRFVDCTALSPALFDCGHSSELIAW